MIVTLLEAKEWLRVDFDEDDSLIDSLIVAAEMYLKNATNKTFDSSNELAKIFIRVLVTDWYENREYEMEGKTASIRVRHTIQSILNQLLYSGNVL